MTRKRIILAVVLILAIILLFIFKPVDRGDPYSDYFASMNNMLKEEGPGRPTLLLDLDRLDHNISTVKKHIQSFKSYRIVAKSLPSIPLIRYIAEQTGTNKIMVFHQPFITLLAKNMPRSEMLLGKPMPIKAAEQFYETFKADTSDSLAYDPANQLEWLIDSPERLQQYKRLADDQQEQLLINIEIDVGLHRGGIKSVDTLDAMLQTIKNEQKLTFSGFMGYDAHIAEAPPILSSKKEALQNVLTKYKRFVDYGRQQYPKMFAKDLTFNGAGSKTYQLYDNDTILNDLAAGSGMVKPTDFDKPTLSDHKPAIFIATPVLKKSEGTHIPFIEFLSPVFAWWNPNRAQTFFIYGGNWKADFCSPPGLLRNPIYGYSSNQELVNGSDNVNLHVDDHIFLRPEQSEAVMLNFGDIRVVRNDSIIDTWDVFEQDY